MSEDTRKGARRDGEGLVHVEDLYQNWFLEYASYVILDRAVPDIRDGLKPVQRRILFALRELDDGRLNKAANVIGHTMRYHPHGDMAIEDALVKLAQKDLLIDMQGNWGNLFTGDRAAAPRYIEGRLSKFAKEVVFQEELTEWQASYDGRNNEPVVLPVKFPLLLALGVEGIAVGLSTKILPHNFAELCDAAIAHLEGKPFVLLPDFPAGGQADFSLYKQGQRGGRVRVRARINILDTKTLQIVDLPFGTTTTSLIESVLAANDKGKIKIKRVEDNTGHQVDIRILLPQGVPPEQTVEALYAFTDCEISIATHACVIREDKPFFCTTHDLLIDAAERTRAIIGKELELEQQKLQNKIRKASLEKLFIEEKVYRKIEGASSWEEALDKLQKAFKPLVKDFDWAVSEKDLEALLEIRFKRLTRYDASEADAQLETLQKQLKAAQKKLSRLNATTIAHFHSLKERYGQEKRRTELATFGEIRAREVVLANQKLYVNRAEGFIGTGLKKDEFVTDCSELDEVFVLRSNGQAMAVKMQDKCFVGEGVFYLALLPANGPDSCLHVLYREKETGHIWARRQRLGPMQKEKSYELIKGDCEILYAKLWEEPGSDWIELERKGCRKPWAFDFASLDLVARAGRGQKISERVLKQFKPLGREAPEGEVQKLSFDPQTLEVGLGTKGKLMGRVAPSTLIYTVSRDGQLIVGPAGENRSLSAPLAAWGVWRSEQIHTAIFGKKKADKFGVRRWRGEEMADGLKVSIFSPKEGEQIYWYSDAEKPLIMLHFADTETAALPPELLALGECAPIKGLDGPIWKLVRAPIKRWETIVIGASEVKT